jgi:hypothetical protein
MVYCDVTFRQFIALLLAFCVGVVGCKRQESATSQSLDARIPFYLGQALTIIPDDSHLTRPEYSKVLAASLRKLNVIDPIKDLDNNLSRGDSKFVGIYGYSCSPPGLDEHAIGNSLTADQKLEVSLGVVCIEGTTDALPDDHQYMDLYKTAWMYAETYNHEYLRRIRKGSVN